MILNLTKKVFIVLVLFITFANAGNGLLTTTYENENFGLILLTNLSSNEINGLFMNDKQSALQFTGTMSSDSASGFIISDNNKVPVHITFHSSSKPYINLSLDNMEPFPLYLIIDHSKARIFTPSTMQVINEMMNSEIANAQAQRKPQQRPQQNYNNNQQSYSTKSNNYIVGVWRGESARKSSISGAYTSSVFYYRFFSNGTFTYGANNAFALEGENQIDHEGQEYRNTYNYTSEGSTDGGQWSLSGNQITLRWRDGTTETTCYDPFHYEGKDRIKLGCNRKQYSFLIRQ